MAKTKETKRRTKVKDLKKSEEELTTDQAKKVKGGILPYIEQDAITSRSITDGTSNTSKSSITDGTSNTLLGGK